MWERNLPNVEKFKYVQISTGSYSITKEADSISNPPTVYMFNVQKYIYFKLWRGP
jgi:hypothetical protein